MDINEKKSKDFHRHPWELSRTKCVMNELKKHLAVDKQSKYLNIGAGDLYFDECWKQIYAKNHETYAVDIGYEHESKNGTTNLYRDLSSVNESNFDYALMMDSLEYMTDDFLYVKLLADKVSNGGKLMFTLPAYSSLYSKHDEIVGNLRRYSFSDFKKLINRIDNLSIVTWHYFYFSLFCFRFMQKFFKLDIDPSHKVTTGWKHSEKNIITRTVVFILDLDYWICKILRIFHFPGLSLFVICKKNDGVL
ncbi:MAG: hypothetical protein K5917_00955 [Clostridiales bacterium]|nr:hypothetical protein [Clostridiales bacterium]